MDIQFHHGKTFFITLLNEAIKNNQFHYIAENQSLYDKLCPHQRQKKPIALRKPMTLNNGVQVETNRSTKDLLSKIKLIAECCKMDIKFIMSKK